MSAPTTNYQKGGLLYLSSKGKNTESPEKPGPKVQNHIPPRHRQLYDPKNPNKPQVVEASGRDLKYDR